jgi:hypothetical protein
MMKNYTSRINIGISRGNVIAAAKTLSIVMTVTE